MINLLLLNKVLIFLTTFGIGYLSVWVLLSNPKSKLNKVFFLWAIFSLSWIIFGYLANSTKASSLALLFFRLRFGAVSIFFIFAYFFSLLLYRRKKGYFVLDKFVITTSIFFLLLSIFSNSIIKNVSIQEWGTEIVFGKLAMLFYGVLIFLTILITIFLVQGYLGSSKEEKTKIQYFLVGAIVFILMNLVFNVVFPILGTYRYYQIGDYSALFLFAFIAYAIVKRELFGIKVVLTALLVGLITILLLLDTLLFTPQLLLQLFKGLVLVLFLYFGYLLIKSVLEEIKRREKIEKMSKRLREAYQELKRLDEAKTGFISMASHQLRTPLSAIKGYVSMTLEGTYGKVPEKMKRPLENVFVSSERLIKIVNDLLNISKIELGKIEMEKKRVQIEDLIDDACNEMNIKAKEKNLYFKWERPKKPLPKVEIDPLKIRQVILNVVDNAIRYTQKGGVEINVKCQMSNVKISVKDTGEGLTKKESSTLFESFTRGSAGLKLWTEGAGLGLYVAKRFLELHNGRIWAESAGKGKGSTFYIEIPIK